MAKLCVDLCCGVGGFSAAFRESPEWVVLGVDNNPEVGPDILGDVMDMSPRSLPSADVYLGSPPCPEFSLAGNHDHWEDQRPVHPKAREAVSLAVHVATLCRVNTRGWWFVENPRGRLQWFLGQPTGAVTYCQYGTPYMKPTHLWGRHPPGMQYKTCHAGDDCHDTNTEDDGTSAVASMPSDHGERSKVPYGLSKAILDAVEGHAEQSTLTEVCHG